MTRVTARGKREFAYGVWDKVRLSIHNGLELTSKNEFPNPKFDMLTGDGVLEFWGEIHLPPRLRGKNIYIRERGGRTTKQNIDGPIGIHRHTYLQDEVLINGEELPGIHALDNVRRAPAPIAEAVNDSVRGYPADNNCQIGYAWIMGKPGRGRLRILTNPSPPSESFVLLEGQTYKATLPRRVPHEAITGIALLHKPPSGSYNDAFIQKIINIRGSIPDVVHLKNYLHGRGLKAPTTNLTYVGWLNRLAPLTTDFGRSPTGRDFTLKNALLSWQFRTEAGWSAMQQAKTLDYDHDRKNTALYLWPKVVPCTAEAWRFVIKLLDGRWYTSGRGTKGQADGGLPLNMPGIIYTGNPDKWQDFNELISVEYQEEDLTGIEAPDEELEIPEIEGLERIEPGAYTAFVTDVYDDGESRPSKPDSAVLSTGENLRITLRDPLNRQYGNVLPNADLSERKPNAERQPLFWTRNLTSQLTAGDGGWEIRDSRGLGSTQNYGESDPFKVNASLPMTLRFYVDMLRRVGGSVGVRMRYLNSSLSTIGTPDTVVADADGWVEITTGLSGNGYEQTWPAGTEYIKFEIVATLGGSASIDLDADILGLGFIVGEAAPRLRNVSEAIRAGNDNDSGPVPLAENTDLAYPEVSYGIVVKNYAGAGINAVEYYGAWDTLVQDRLLTRGFEVPVEEGRNYTLQVEVEGRGLASSTRLFKGAFIDEEGAILDETNGVALSPNAAGITSGVKSENWTAPTGAVAWRATSNTIGRGRLNYYKPQFERGNSATAWTSAYQSPGTVTQIFDLWCPGAGITDKNGMLSVVKELYDIVARANDPENTSVSARIAFKAALNTGSWSAWYTDPEAISWLDVLRFAKIEVTLSTTDLQVSPELYEYGVEVEREEPILLRRDGSEFFGGIHVSNMPALNFPENDEARRSRSGNEQLLELFRAKNRILEGLEFTGYNRRGVEQAHAEAAKGDRIFEIQFRQKRYIVRILKLKFELQGKESPAGFGEWVATGVSATVIEVKDLV